MDPNRGCLGILVGSAGLVIIRGGRGQIVVDLEGLRQVPETGFAPAQKKANDSSNKNYYKNEFTTVWYKTYYCSKYQIVADENRENGKPRHNTSDRQLILEQMLARWANEGTIEKLKGR